MSSWRISADGERWIGLARRFGIKPDDPLFAGHIGGWRSVRLISRCAFFGLGCVAAMAAFAVLHFLHIDSMLVPGVLLIAVAETLIISRRLVFCGVEEAFELLGLLMVVAAVMEHMHSSSDARAAVLVALAFLIAGLRLLNPLFTTLAAVATSVAFQIALDKHALVFSPRATFDAGLYGYAIALLALGFSAIRFVRPSHARMLDWLVIAMPVAGYLWLAGSHGFKALDYWHERSLEALLTPVLPLGFGLAALATGLRRRTHAPLLAFMLCVACVAYELRALTGLSLEVRLIVWGGVLLIAALLLERWLRQPHCGVTSKSVSHSNAAMRLLELAGASVATSHGQPGQTGNYHGGGGRGGGGGASGEY